MFNLHIDKKLFNRGSDFKNSVIGFSCLAAAFVYMPYSHAQTPEQVVTKSPAALLIEAKTLALEACITTQMAGLESAAKKRQQIAENCEAQKQELVSSFPADIKEFMLINIDRRVAAVLAALEDMEGVVSTSVSDVNDIVEELNAASQSQPE